LYGAVKYPKIKTRAPDKTCKMKTLGLKFSYLLVKIGNFSHPVPFNALDQVIPFHFLETFYRSLKLESFRKLTTRQRKFRDSSLRRFHRIAKYDRQTDGRLCYS